MVALWFILGLVLLIVGAELLVRGASRLAVMMGVPPLVIGLTIVSFGTSAPELAVSVKSAFAGQSGLAVGNIVGSNIFNVLFILGISAVIAPLVVSRRLVWLDVPLMVGASISVLLMGLDLRISRADGGILFGALVIYFWHLFRAGSRETDVAGLPGSEGIPGGSSGLQGWKGVALQLAFVAGGLIMLVLGSRWLVSSAVSVAEAMGVTDLIIGLTIIAAGTSLPEIVTSVMASLKGERDIAVGNVVGSNILNLLGVLGLSGLVAPDGIPLSPGVLRFDFPIMIAVAVACLPIFFTGHSIGRWEGALLFGYYIAYTAYLVMMSTEADLLELYRAALLFFVIPLTVVTLSVVTVRAARERRSRRAVG